MSGNGRLLERLMMTAAVLALAACAQAPAPSRSTGPALPSGAYYKIGKPYQVSGVWYYPKEDYNYDETGIASWYGPGFHAERTANGEIFDQNEITAAHKTLPMPVLVRVTNLENGRQIVVRINDRGPFVAGRIIDLSRRSAQLLGMMEKGTAKVRVQILAEESRAIAAAAKAGQPAGGVAVAGLSADGAPVPRAAPRASIQVEGDNTQPVRHQAPIERTPVVETANLPGEVKEGRFLPAPVVSEVKVTGARQIYIQAGAFSRQSNAQQLRSKLSGIGPVAISEAWVGGGLFYRVRLGPMATVDEADTVLNKVIAAGITENARVVVD